MNYFAKNILTLRKKRKLSQAQMPDYTGIGRATWSDYENSNTEPKIDSIISISEFFRVDLTTLLTVDLSINVQAMEKIEALWMDVKSTTNYTTISTTNELNDPENQLEDLKKKATDLLILEQLNSLTSEVKGLRKDIEQKRV